jgi:Histidine kinase-, DNA gyrase B-, and HSP90-like ATPase
MITRDISLEDCILDLIDNSIDGAWRSEGSRPMGLAEQVDLSKYNVNVTATKDNFSITDNCGGMTLDDAADHAFSFGRKSSDATDNYSIGVYGIGMKRAIFKIGKMIKIRSSYSDDGDMASFAVPIDVDEWLKDDSPPWDFDIVEQEDLDQKGVRIDIENLQIGAANSFSNPAFVENLRRIIGRDYSLHLHRGLNISVNDKPVIGWQINLKESDELAPMRIEYNDKINGENVHVQVIGGMAAAPPETADPDVEDEAEKRYGWYVICNGRIVLAADKTAVSGWGSESWPQWHRQYSGFIGLILFTSESAAALPLTTTKRSVDLSSEVYRRARPSMRDVTRSWIDYTNSRKQALEEAKKKEALAKPVTIYSVKERQIAVMPKLTPVPKVPMANVLYSVPRAKLKKLAAELGSSRMSYRDVGIKAFDYTYEDLVGDE